MTPAQEDVWTRRQNGESWKKISKDLNISIRSARERYNRARNHVQVDPGVARAMDSVGTEMVPQSLWIKNKEFSVQLRPKQPAEMDFLAKLEQAFDGIPTLPEIKKPRHTLGDLMTTYPLFDVHYGLRATAAISGHDMDYDIARKRLLEGFQATMSLSPNSKRGILVNGGDFTHADDDENCTPTNKHVLDVAGRNYTTVDGAVDLITDMLALALQKHERVEYYSVPGNHDPKNWMAIMFALAERFRENPRVIIEKSPVEFSVITHGGTLIVIHHGHKKKDLKDLILWFAATYPQEWANAKYRTLWTGHNHHLLMKEFPGMFTEQHSPITVPDHYAFSSAYSSIPIIQAITYNTRGEVVRTKDFMQ